MECNPKTPMRRYDHDVSQKLVSFDGRQKHIAEAFDALRKAHAC